MRYSDVFRKYLQLLADLARETINREKIGTEGKKWNNPVVHEPLVEGAEIAWYSLIHTGIKFQIPVFSGSLEGIETDQDEDDFLNLFDTSEHHRVR